MFPLNNSPLLFAHIGDLHIDKVKQQNYIDFLQIIAQLETQCVGQLNFVFLPGDVADHGQPEQYRMVATALKMLNTPVHLIAGDHDMEQGSLQNFYEVPAAQSLPKSISLRGSRCLFIDVNGTGKGGPDFRIGATQFGWLANELAAAKTAGETPLIFMHTYPDDLVEASEKMALNKLIAEYDVALVDMGHTHYNELANDGQTIFAATRSTGQIEEGPVGYTFLSVQDGVVSWRFKPLDDAFPFVLITSPADYRLMRGSRQAVAGQMQVTAVVLGNIKVNQVSCRTMQGKWLPMTVNEQDVWAATLPVPEGIETVILTVRAINEDGWPGQHTIQVATLLYQPVPQVKDGSDKASIGAWPENGIPGTQLGPNRNAKPKK